MSGGFLIVAVAVTSIVLFWKGPPIVADGLHPYAEPNGQSPRGLVPVGLLPYGFVLSMESEIRHLLDI